MRTPALFLLIAGAVVAQSIESFQYLDSSLTPYGINNDNVVVGVVGNSAFRLPMTTGTVAQFSYPGAGSTVASDINNNDQIVGWYSDGVHSHCFTRQSSGTMSSYDVPGATDTFCRGINDVGQIVGSYVDSAGKSHGFLLSGGTLTVVDYPGIATGSYAIGIANSGEIAGHFDSEFPPIGSSKMGFRRKVDGTYVLLSYGQTNRVGGINNLGQIAATSAHVYGSPIFNGSRGIVDTNGSISFTLDSNSYGGNSSAIAINDSGVIVGIVAEKSYVSVPCAIQMNPSAATSISGAAQTLNVQVTAAASCGYLVRSQSSWLHTPVSARDPIFGPGNSTLSIGVDVNADSASRNGTVTIAGQSLAVTQSTAFVCPPVFGSSSLQLSSYSPDQPAVVRVYASNGCSWSATTDADWLTVRAGSAGGGTSDLVVTGKPFKSANSTPRTAHVLVGSESAQVVQGPVTSCSQYLSSSIFVDPAGGAGSFRLATDASCNWTILAPPWITITSAKTGAGSTSVSYSVGANTGTVERYDPIRIDFGNFDVNYYYARQPAPGALTGNRFIPITPCRIADTRAGSGFVGSFGAPSLPASGKRTIPVPQSACGIPATAKAYSLNVTAVPKQPLSYITAWPTGSPQPYTSVLNSPAGAIVANAALVQAGTNGSVDFFATDPTDLVLDINGYFVDANNTQALAYYPLTPCRIADTRPNSGFIGPFGAPLLSTASSLRTIPVLLSNCGIPSTPKAYVLNVTAVPTGSMPYLTVWPAGRAQPFASTLNSPEGRIVANAAIIPAGDSGDISVYANLAQNATAGVVIDINGYFGPPNGQQPLSFYPITPCRLGDTRVPDTNQGLAAPALSGGPATRVVYGSSTCVTSPSIGAYALNATVVPLNGALGFLSLFPFGASQPFTSTLNSTDGRIVSNAAIVSSELGYPYRFTAYSLTDQNTGTHLILDMWGYFAP